MGSVHLTSLHGLSRHRHKLLQLTCSWQFVPELPLWLPPHLLLCPCMSGQSFGISYGKVGRLKLSRPRQQTRKCLLVCSIGRKKKGFSNQTEGKKAALGILNSVKSSLAHQKVEEKRKALYSNFYDENQTYLLFYEDGQKVFFLHGTSELFTLK